MPAVSVRVRASSALSLSERVWAETLARRRPAAAGFFTLLQQREAQLRICCQTETETKSRKRAEADSHKRPRAWKVAGRDCRAAGKIRKRWKPSPQRRNSKTKKSTAEVLPSRAAPRCGTSPRPPGASAGKHMNINEAGDGKGETVLSELFLDKCLKQGSN